MLAVVLLGVVKYWMNSFASPDTTTRPTPLAADTASRTRAPTSRVGSPGRVTIRPSPICTAISGTAFGTLSVLSGMPSLWPWPGTGSGLRVPSNGTRVTSNSGPLSSSEPVRNGKPIIG